MKTVQVHVKYNNELENSPDSNNNALGSIDPEFYIGRRPQLPLLGSVNSHLIDKGGLEQYIIRAPKTGTVRQSLDLHSITEDDRPLLAEMEVSPSVARRQVKHVHSDEGYEELVFNVPKLGAMLNVMKTKGRNYYEKAQEMSKKRLQAIYQGRLSPRPNTDPNLVLDDTEEIYTPREPVEPPAPKSKPIHFINRPRPKTSPRYRKPGPSEFVQSVENVAGPNPMTIETNLADKNNMISKSFSHSKDDPPSISAIEMELITEAVLTQASSVLEAPSMSATSPTGTGVIKQSKAIPPPTFVSVCLPAVVAAASSAQSSNTSILTSADLLKRQQQGFPNITVQEGHLKSMKSIVSTEDRDHSNKEKVRFALPSHPIDKKVDNNKDEKLNISEKPHSAGAINQSQRLNLLMLGDEEQVQCQYRPALTPGSRGGSRNGRPTGYLGRISSKPGNHKNQEERFKSHSKRPISPQKYFNQTLDDFNWRGQEGVKPNMTDTYDEGQTNRPASKLQPSSPKHRVMMLSHQIAQQLDIVETPEEHYNPRQYDVPITILSASEHLQRLIEEEKARLVKSQKDLIEPQESSQVTISIPSEMVQAMHKQIERFQAAQHPSLMKDQNLSKQVKSISPTVSICVDPLLAHHSIEEGKGKDEEDVTPGEELVLRWRAFIGKSEHPSPARPKSVEKEEINPLINNSKAAPLLSTDWLNCLYDLPPETQPNDPDLKILNIDSLSLASIFAKPSLPPSSTHDNQVNHMNEIQRYLKDSSHPPDPQSRVVKLNLQVPSSRIERKSLKARPLTAGRQRRRSKEVGINDEKDDKELAPDFSMQTKPVRMQSRQGSASHRRKCQ